MARTATKKNQSTALALPKGNQPIEDVQRQLEALQKHAHVLVPIQALQEVPESFELCFAGFQLNPDPNAGDFYTPGVFARSGQAMRAPSDDKTVCLPYNTQKRLAQIANIQTIPSSVIRLDDGKNPFIYGVRLAVTGRTFDGEVRTEVGECTLDYTDEANEGLKLSSNDLKTKRRFISRLAFSIAHRRAVSSWLALKSSYKYGEIKNRPFVVARLRYIPDMSDPVIKRMVAAKELGMENMLYGGGVNMSAVLGASTEPVAGKLIAQDISDGEIIASDDFGGTELEASEAAIDADFNPETGEVSEPEIVEAEVVEGPDVPADLSGQSVDNQVVLITNLAQFVKYDYRAKLAAKEKDPDTPLEDLPQRWRDALWSALVREHQKLVGGSELPDF